MRYPAVEWREPGGAAALRPRSLTPPTLPGLLVVGAIGLFVAALLLCCLLSLRIVAEHDRVAALDRAIADAQREVTTLHQEVAIRTRYRELDRWNAVLGLAPPRADQYLAGQTALAAYAPRRARRLG